MFAREESIHVDAPPEAVYDYVSDLTRHPEWAAQKMTMRNAGSGRFESVVVSGPITARSVLRIEAARRPEDFIYVADDDVSGPHRWHFNISTESNGSRVKLGFERMHDRFPFTVLQPLVFYPLIGHPGLVKGLANIKRVVEGTSTERKVAPSAS